MADITQTAASVAKGTGASVQTVFAGEAVTAGDLVYKNLADANKYYRADANDTAAKAVLAGIALSSAPGAGQPLVVQTGGRVNPGGTVAVGQVYAVSTNVGKVAPYGDLSTGHYVSVFGVGISASEILMAVTVSGVQKP